MSAMANRRDLARALSVVENRSDGWRSIVAASYAKSSSVAVVGVTGPPGSGKSTLIDAIAFDWARRGEMVAVLAVDPASPISGGAVLGDRIRMRRSETLDNVLIRSFSTHGHPGGLNEAATDLCTTLAGRGISRIILETVGAGQNEVDVAFVADCVVVVSAPGLGDSLQASKAGILEIGDLHVVNKADLPGAGSVAQDLTTMLSLVFSGKPGVNDTGSARPAAARIDGEARASIEAHFGAPGAVDGFWHPPVLRVSATDDATVAPLIESIEACLAWLKRSACGEARAEKRRRTQLEAIITRMLFQRLVRAVDKDGDRLSAWVRRGIERGTDPYTLAERILAEDERLTRTALKGRTG